MVLAPLDRLNPPDQADLLHDYVDPAASWSISHSWGGGRGHRVAIEAPMEHLSSETLAAGEKLIFWRHFHGVDRPTKIELSQKLVHCLDLHFMEEHNAFCRLGAHGEIEQVIRIIEVAPSATYEGGEIVTVLKKDFMEYMALSRMGSVTLFDFTRCPPDSFNGWNDDVRETRDSPDLFYTVGVMHGHASFANGRFIVRPTMTIEEIIADRARANDPAARQFATFKIFDRKNDRQIETSCSPESIASYFETGSPLPWHISPAFFRPDVLHRFKSDREKYRLDDRSISCRGAWSLKTYDINEAGQVHTYIKYLSNLPYEEQLYWQAFNEWPSGTISARAFETDIEGTWSTQYDPLASLKRKITVLDAAPPPWWRSRDAALHTAARHPVTTSSDEWANEILALDQLIVEGFVVTGLREIATRIGQPVETPWASLKVLEACLIGQGRTAEQAKAVVAPLFELHALRTPLRGHGAVALSQKLAREAIRTHGNFRAHYAELAGRCDSALGSIFTTLGMDVGQE
jgi:hypothetical protein